MKRLLLNVFNGRIVSPWWILLVDMGIVVNAYVLSFVLRISMQLDSYSVLELIISGGTVFSVYIVSYLISGSYRGVIRHSSYNEFKQLITACISAFAILLVCDIVGKNFKIEWWNMSRSVLVFHAMLTIILSFLFRMLVKEIYSYLTKKKTNINTFIYGAGEMGQITYEAIKNDTDNMYSIVGFIDDNSQKWNMKVQSLPVTNWEKAILLAHEKGIEVIILAINKISVQRKKQISNDCLNAGIKLKIMPSVGSWVNGISNQNQIRDIRIEDILGRDEIKLSQAKISDGLKGKTILVSGAAGSIGSEIVRQLLKFPLKKILLVDMAESVLYDLQQELLLSYYDAPFKVLLADCTNSFRMRQIFEEYRPQIIFNAAAYKHVPLMEANPYEAIRVNIGGTKLLADLSIEYDVEKFVMVSTDKAVNPTNVMGASKRICEVYIQSLSQKSNANTAFITTRFGNVLGSNGSVVPLFKKQIAQGGPVTVTHKDITRFFMTIPEACQLVLEAGFMGKGGEIYLFDMGQAVKIDNLAKEMIKLAGLKLGEDIDISYTGLRPGEKLYEELLSSKEGNLPTHHEKIMIGKVNSYSHKEVDYLISELLKSIHADDNAILVSRMKELVPEYVSNNSEFSILDRVTS